MKVLKTLNTATVVTHDLEEQIAIAATTGFDGVGLWLSDIEDYLRNGASISEIRSAVDRAGIVVSEICYIPLFGNTSHSFDEESVGRAIGIAVGCGAPILVGVPAPDKSSCVDLSPQAISEVCRIADAGGVRIALEYVCTAVKIRTIEDAIELVENVAAPNFGILVDLFHTYSSGSGIDSINRIGKEKLFLVHVSDAMNVSEEELTAFHDNRTFPGKGVIDLKRQLVAIDAFGYQGHYSLEIWNRQPLSSSDRQTALIGLDRLTGVLERASNRSLPLTRR